MAKRRFQAPLNCIATYVKEGMRHGRQLGGSRLERQKLNLNLANPRVNAPMVLEESQEEGAGLTK